MRVGGGEHNRQFSMVDEWGTGDDQFCYFIIFITVE